MARPLRIEYEGAVYHVVSRGNDGQRVFKESSDYELFMNSLKNLCERYNIIFYGYCLMSNHYHLLFETPDGNLSSFMRQVNGIYTQKYNKKYQKKGHLFQGRYKAMLIQKEGYLIEVLRYVVLNPVRAKMVEKVCDYEWSSYKGTLRGDKYLGMYLDKKFLLKQFGMKEKEACAEYRRFVRAGIKVADPFKSSKGSLFLGDDGMLAELRRVLTQRRKEKEIPVASRFVDRPELPDIFNVVGKERKKRNAQIIRAHVEYGYKGIEIADYLKMHYSTISRIINESL